MGLKKLVMYCCMDSFCPLQNLVLILNYPNNLFSNT